MNQQFRNQILYYALSFMLIVCIFYLLSVFDTFGSFMHFFEETHLHKWHTLFRFFIVVVFGVVNHWVFVPRFYISKRYLLFFSIVLLCLVILLVLPDILLPQPHFDHKRLEFGHPNPLPPSPLILEMVIMFLLFFIGTFTSIVIKTNQYLQQIEQEKKAISPSLEHEKEEIIEKQLETGLTVTVNYSLIRIEFSEILFIKSMDNYLQFHLKDKKPILVRMTLKEATEKLPIDRFLRVHKSYIVPITGIESIRNKTILIAKNEIPIGKTYEESLSKFFGQ